MLSKRVVVIGGGHAAQTFAALLPFKGHHTTLYSAFGDEALRLKKCLAENGGKMLARFASHNTPTGDVVGAPAVAADEAEARAAFAAADVIVLPLPSFAIEPALKSIVKLIDKERKYLIVFTPGQGGADYIARAVLGDDLYRRNNITLTALVPMPFNCRIEEFGKLVNVQQFEKEYYVASIGGDSSVHDDVPLIIRSLLGDHCHVDDCGHFLSATLFPLNANIHPQHLYVLLKDFKDGKVYDENPLFYESMRKETGELMHATSDEVQAICGVLRSRFPALKLYVPTIFESEVAAYRSQERYKSIETVDEFFSTFEAYKGFRSPFKAVEGGFVPDIQHRYWTEDIPLSLCVWKAIAELADIETPTITRLLRFHQQLMGKEYVGKDGLVTSGRNVAETSIPQNYGIKSLEELIQ